MDTSLTSDQAQTRLLTYLRDTLAVLPLGIDLSLDSDNQEFGTFPDTATVVPADDNDHDGTGPVALSMDYWLTGVPKGRIPGIITMIRSHWHNSGWSVTADMHHSATARTPDRFTLNVQGARADDGSFYDGGLSIEGSSPAYPRTVGAALTPAAALPLTLQHP